MIDWSYDLFNATSDLVSRIEPRANPRREIIKNENRETRSWDITIGIV